MTRVLFTGGGTAGHVTPNIALLEAAAGKSWEVAYVGSAAGIEREMIGALGDSLLLCFVRETPAIFLLEKFY